MSAIDWLSDSLTVPAQTGPLGSDVSSGAQVAPVTVTPLDGAEAGANLNTLGLLSAARAGLPNDLWGDSPAQDLAQLLAKTRTPSLPEAQALLIRLLLAETEPPQGLPDQFFLTRVDKLLSMGALEQAHALLELAGTQSAQAVRRWFDTGLLIGDEDRVCAALEAAPDITPTYPTRVFCLARAGDWDGAVLLMGTGRALGLITPEEDALLARFLDPELFEGEPPLPIPDPVTPLEFRLFEAIGDPIATSALPLAFAHSDLRDTIGWKAQLAAGERLARAGALSDARLAGLYTSRQAAASGGVWERARLVRALDLAIKASDTEDATAILPEIWPHLTEGRTEVPVARVYGAKLAAMGLDGPSGAVALRMGLLGDAYEAVALDHEPTNADSAFWLALAKGDLANTPPPNKTAQAVADGFSGASQPQGLIALAHEGHLGEAILRALALIDEGAAGELDALAQGLGFLHGVGLESTARKIALEVLILERRG